MAVDDFGTEVLKKAAEEIIPGDRSDYLIKMQKFSEGPVTDNAIEAIKTSVPASTATKINIPSTAEKIVIRHRTNTILWVGGTDAITIDGSDAFPLFQNETLSVSVAKGNTNNIFGIAVKAVPVYVMGVIKE